MNRENIEFVNPCGEWLCKHHEHVLHVDSIYRLKPEPPKPDYVSWEILPDWVRFVARDKDGEAYGYGYSPQIGPETWQCDGSLMRLDHFSDKLFKAGDLPWGQSLIERPKGDTK